MNHYSYEQRRRAVEATVNGYLQREAGDMVGATQASVHDWVKRYRLGGWDALRDQSHYKATPERIKELIRETRRQHPDWSAYRIAAHVQPHRYPDNEATLTASHVRDVLDEAGLW
jgi:transposase